MRCRVLTDRLPPIEKSSTVLRLVGCFRGPVSISALPQRRNVERGSNLPGVWNWTLESPRGLLFEPGELPSNLLLLATLSRFLKLPVML